MDIVGSRKSGSSTVSFSSRRSLSVTVAPHRFSATTKKKKRYFHRTGVSYANSSGDVNLTTPDDAACNLALGGFVRRESHSFGWLRQALVHVHIRNSLDRLPQPSSTHTRPLRFALPAKLITLVMALRLTRAHSSNLSTQLRRAQIRNKASLLVSAPGADHQRTHDSEQIRAAAVTHHTVYEETQNLYRNHVCQ